MLGYNGPKIFHCNLLIRLIPTQPGEKESNNKFIKMQSKYPYSPIAQLAKDSQLSGYSKCDRICEKGSYSLFKFPTSVSCKSQCVQLIDVKFLPGMEPCYGCKVTKFQVGTKLTCFTMDGQMHGIGKAIRPLFADPVTNRD